MNIPFFLFPRFLRTGYPGGFASHASRCLCLQRNFKYLREERKKEKNESHYRASFLSREKSSVHFLEFVSANIKIGSMKQSIAFSDLDSKKKEVVVPY